MVKKRYYVFLDDVWCIRDRKDRKKPIRVGMNKGFAVRLCELLNEQESEWALLKATNIEQFENIRRLQSENEKD